MTFFLPSANFHLSLAKSSLARFANHVKSFFPAEFFQSLTEEIRKKGLFKKRKK